MALWKSLVKQLPLLWSGFIGFSSLELSNSSATSPYNLERSKIIFVTPQNRLKPDEPTDSRCASQSSKRPGDHGLLNDRRWSKGLSDLVVLDKVRNCPGVLEVDYMIAILLVSSPIR
ncbi:hypothetical protein OUZ56_033858, partial [Daphnia magna]